MSDDSREHGRRMPGDPGTWAATWGVVLAVAGPDGSGKSSLADALEREARGEPVLRVHHRPGVLPFRSSREGPVTDPHRDEPYPRWLSTLKVLYLFSDYAAGWMLRIRPMLLSGGLVVLERGWWDLAIDARRYRLQGVGPLVRLLGRLLPTPAVTLVLRAPVEVLLARTIDDIRPEEFARQLAVFDELYAHQAGVVFLDATRPAEVVISDALRVVSARLRRPPIEGRWVALPSGRRPRWTVPHAPRRAAANSLLIYKPVTGKAVAGWSVARGLAAVGAFRLLPGGSRSAPEAAAWAEGWVPAGGTVAVGRTRRPGRHHLMTLDVRGNPYAMIKVALDQQGALALAHEAQALQRIHGLLPAPVRSPRLLHLDEHVLVTEAVPWTADAFPWRLPEPVAAAMGTWYGRRASGPNRMAGPAHADFTPWNLLRVRREWVLCDWAAAQEEAPAFFDILHWMVSAHALLGRPTLGTLLAGLDGGGWVGGAIGAWARGAGLPPELAVEHVPVYLDATAGSIEPEAEDGRRVLLARDRLRAAVAKGVRPPTHRGRLRRDA